MAKREMKSVRVWEDIEVAEGVVEQQWVEKLVPLTDEEMEQVKKDRANPVLHPLERAEAERKGGKR